MVQIVYHSSLCSKSMAVVGQGINDDRYYCINLIDTNSDKTECKGQGIANIVAGLFGGMAVAFMRCCR